MSKVRITVVQAKDILIAKHLLLAVKSTKLIKVWIHNVQNYYGTRIENLKIQNFICTVQVVPNMLNLCES